MAKIAFYKLQASGNDFILIDNRRVKINSTQLRKLAKEYCQRKLGIGADGFLVIEASRKAFFRMRIFNPDGSEAEMCGNGARCAAYWAKPKSGQVKFVTKAGIIESSVKGNDIEIKLSDPKRIKLHIPITVLGRKIKVDFINTGVPQVAVFVEGLEKIDVEKIGRAIRFHKKFQPAGANVNFVEVLKSNQIKLRTYERGVEAETLACGTGCVASVILATARFKNSTGQYKVKAQTLGREILDVQFSKIDGKVKNVWLEGKANLVYQGSLRF